MNARNNLLSQGHGAKHTRGQQPGNPQTHKPGVMPPKIATTAQMKKLPVAPAVYRPQPVPKVLQTKMAVTHQPVHQSRPAPIARPAYRPQPVPKVLQTKIAFGQQSHTGQSKGKPVAPPIYRPETKKIVQPKMAASAQAHNPPKAPPVYRPQPTPRVLQTKVSQMMAAGQSNSATPVGRLPLFCPQTRSVEQRAGRVLNPSGPGFGGIGRGVVTKAEATSTSRLFVLPQGVLQAKIATVQRRVAPSRSVIQLGKKKSKGAKRKGAKAKKESLKLDQVAREAQLESAPTATPTFHAFGDEERVVAVNPDQTGANAVTLTGTRPEDAPIVERFRVAYNQLDSWALYLETNHPDIYEEANEKFDLDSRHKIVKEVKAETQEYKKKYRDLGNMNILIDQANFEVFLEDKADEIRAILGKVAGFMVSQKYQALNLTTSTVHGAGTLIWRAKWTKAVQTVNAILKELWPPARVEIDRWILKQSSIKTKVKTGELTYIGSLAKAYKGPPKQHIRFNPSDFDIDANLKAPSLAEYAMRVNKLLPDRGRIFARNTTIRPLIAFADKVQTEMIKRVDGIEENPDDLFDVVIEAGSTLDQQAQQADELASYAVRDAAI